jgi:outer membrane protein assembly factor BamB
MKPCGRRLAAVFAVSLWWAVLAVPGTVAADESASSSGSQAPPCQWPQFHGPHRDNLSTETGLLKRWPEGGPRLIWKAAGIGHGFATVSVADGRIYTAGNIDGRTVITALDMAGGSLWQAANGPAYERSFPGARSTPTLADGLVYHLNGDGDVACLDAQTGARIWTVSLTERFAGRGIRWGLAESLLVDRGRVFCFPGGEDVGMAALDARSGQTIWTCRGEGDMPSYSSPILVGCGGLRQIVAMTSASAIGVDADSGRLLWRVERPAPYDVNVSTPVYHDGHVAIFTTWGRGATQLKLDVDGRQCGVRQVWHTEELDNEHGGVVLVDGYLYGHADGNHKRRHWACLDWATGRTMYSVDGLPTKGSGCLTYADGMLYLVSDRGAVALVPADPSGFEIVSQFDLPKGGEGPSWAHPVVCGGRLYLRHGDFLYVYDIRAEQN